MKERREGERFSDGSRQVRKRMKTGRKRIRAKLNRGGETGNEEEREVAEEVVQM